MGLDVGKVVEGLAALRRLGDLGGELEVLIGQGRRPLPVAGPHLELGQVAEGVRERRFVTLRLGGGAGSPPASGGRRRSHPGI